MTSAKSTSKLKDVRKSNVLFDGDVSSVAAKLKPGNIRYRVMMAICALVLVGCGVAAAQYFHQTIGHQGEFDDLAKTYTSTPLGQAGAGAVYGKAEDGLPPIVDFDGLREENPDVAGWIRIPNTSVDYPVVASPSYDYYLYRGFYGGYSILGSIFLDEDNSIASDDDHMVIYGHHMDTSVMFHDVALYRYEDFFAEHRVLYYETPDYTYVLRPVGVHIADGSEYEVRRVDFADGNDFQRYFDEQMGNCDDIYYGDFDRATSDRLFTLITCTNYDDSRVVVQCVVDQVYPTSYVPNVIANSPDVEIG